MMSSSASENDDHKTPSPERRGFQFSLRSVFMVTLWAALLCGWAMLGVQWRRFESFKGQGGGFVAVAVDDHARGKGQLLVREYAITVPTHRYLLLRNEQGVGAFMLTDAVSTGDGGVRYQWHFTPDPADGFTGPNATSGESVVFEKYNRRSTPQGVMVTGAGGQLWIQFGPFKLEWSMGNHVYLPTQRPMELAYTDEVDVASLDPNSPELIWCSRGGAEVENR